MAHPLLAAGPMPRIAVLRLAPPILFALAACGGAAETSSLSPVTIPEGAAPSDAGPPAVKAEALPFTPCSVETGGSDEGAECADVEVPLDWAKPDGKTVTIFVKRIRGSAPGPHAQMWLLQGGPGGAGDGLEPMAAEVLSRNGAFDVYIPDHRGTGRSAFLDCPVSMTTRFDPAACGAELVKAWGRDGLATFTTTTAARDVGHLVERTREAGQKVHVYGVSYGTYWAQRYLQLFPDQATAVTLDSVCQSGLCSFLKIDYWRDTVGKKFLGECASDAVCGAKLGPDPVAKVREAMAVADAGTCDGTAGMNGEYLQAYFGYFLASFQIRSLIPALTYRILRCSPADVTALKSTWSTLSQLFGGGFLAPRGAFAPARDLSSTALGFHIAFSEMEESPPVSRDALRALMKDAVFATYRDDTRDAYDAWPRYERDEHVGKYPSSSTPVLLMNGSLDPQTPQEFADAVAPHYTKPGQTYVVFPRAAHGVTSQSPTRFERGDGEPCGRTVWEQFVAAPTAALDTSCTSRILAHDFTDTSWLARYFFKTTSLWGDEGDAPDVQPASLTREGEAITRELRRMAAVTLPWQRLEALLRASAPPSR